MTKKQISPETAFEDVQRRIIAVIDSAEEFAATLIFPHEEFKSKTYNDFREAGRTGWREYEHVALSTLINYGVVRVTRSEFKERIVEDYWGDSHYRVNGEKVINEYELNTLLKALPDVGSMVTIEKLDGKPVQAKINYYKIDYVRIEELERMKNMLASFSE